MNVKKVLEEILTYYTVNRQVGHTHAMLEGARNTDCIVIAHNQAAAHRFIRKGVNAISIGGISALRGCNRPIVFDNATLYVLFNEMLKLNDSDAKYKLQRIVEIGRSRDNEELYFQTAPQELKEG